MTGVSRTIPATGATSLATFTIKVDSTVIARSYRIVSIAVNHEINRISSARIMLLDGSPHEEDFPISNEETFAPGKELEILCGFSNDEQSIYKGLIAKHSLRIRKSSSPLLIIECKDAASKLTISKKNKYFFDKKDSAIFEEIIDESGVGHDVEPTDIEHKQIVQYYSTDWDFIVTRAEANGKYCFTDAGTIIIKAPDISQASKFDVLFGSSIIEFDAEIDARYQYSGIDSKSWSYADQELKTTQSADPGIEEEGNISSSDLSSIFNASAFVLQHGAGVDENQLQAWADAQFLKSRLAKIRGRVKFRGYDDIKPGEMISLNGVGDKFNGKVFVSGVRHEIQNGVWETDVQFGLSRETFAKQFDIDQLPAQGMLPAIKGIHIGIVTDLEDPDNEFRVRVKIPSISMDEDGVWSRIATLDAGDTRGTFFRPELNDEVVVGFFDNDPRYPVILGMLNSSAKAAGITPSNDNNEKGYISRSGMIFIFNDDEKSIKLETPAGKKITVDEQNALMSMEDENGNIVKFEADGITMESSGNITLTAGGTLTLGAAQLAISGDGSVKMEASGSLEMTSSGNTTIKGSLVMIN